MPLDTFGGGVTHPSDVSFKLVVLDADLTLEWPSLSESDDNVIARTMEVQPEDEGFSITLPDARQASLGQDVLIRNTGDAAVAIKDNEGNSIASVQAGEVKYFYLTGNTSAAGTWGIFLFGVGASSADASLLAGLGLKVIGTTLNQAYPAVETTSDITISSADRARLYVYTGGSHSITLPTSQSLGSDFFFLVKNAGAGTVTVLASGADTLDGGTSLLIQPNDGVIFFSGGSASKWYSVAQGRSVQFAFTQLVKNVGGATNDIVLSSSEAQNKVITFTGTLVQSINVVVPNTVSVYYLFNNTDGAFALTVRTEGGDGVAITQGSREIVVCDGSDVRRGVDNTSATTLFSEGSETAPSITFVTDPDTGFYHHANNQAAITAGGTDVMLFTGVPGGVNTFEALSSVSGDPVKLTAQGDDASVSLLFKAKGAGEVLFEDVDFTVRDSADSTKKLGLDCTLISTNTKRVIAVPDADGIFVLEDAEQTLANKTIDSPIFIGSQPKENVSGVGDVVTLPAGAVIDFAGSTAPAGWLMCFGQEVSRITYARLFAAIGITYGDGDGTTTFNLPDCQGRVIAGKDDMSGFAANRLTPGGSGVNGVILGATGGEETHQLTEAELAAHGHPITDPGHSHAGVWRSGSNNINGNPGLEASFGSTNSATTNITVDNAGGDQPHQNTQPTIVMNKIIKC